MVSKNEYTTSEDKNKQIHSQIKVHNEHLKNIIETDKYKKKKKKKLTSSSKLGHKTEYNYSLRNQTINIGKSNKGVTKKNLSL